MVYRALRAGSDAGGGIVGVEMGTGADGQDQIALTTAWASGPEEGRQTWILDAESLLEADSDPASPEGPAPREPGL
jgi:hypothetical protein